MEKVLAQTGTQNIASRCCKNQPDNAPFGQGVRGLMLVRDKKESALKEAERAIMLCTEH